MTASEADLATWRAAIGRTASRRQLLDGESLRRFAVAIGADPAIEHRQPPLSSWAWFLDAVAEKGLGPDGHPKRGGFLPAVTLERRMFAAASFAFHAPLRLGAEAVLDSRIADVTRKSGASGDLVFVLIDRMVAQDGVPCVSERQTIVYRSAGEAPVLPTLEADAGVVPEGGEL